MAEIFNWLVAKIVSKPSETIAIGALLFIAYQAYLTRRHNRLSVRPHIVTNAYGKREENRYIFVLSLQNNGIGPAIITECDLYYIDRRKIEMKKIGSFQDHPDVLKAAIDEEMLALQPLTIKILEINSYDDKYSLRAGAEATLLKISVPLDKVDGSERSLKDVSDNMPDDIKEKRAEEFMDKFKVAMFYLSMYDEKFSGARPQKKITAIGKLRRYIQLWWRLKWVLWIWRLRKSDKTKNGGSQNSET